MLTTDGINLSAKSANDDGTLWELEFNVKLKINTKDKIIAYLEQSGGSSHLHDKSDPNEIRSILNISKKTFKNTIGILYKEKKIIIKNDGIELVK